MKRAPSAWLAIVAMVLLAGMFREAAGETTSGLPARHRLGVAPDWKPPPAAEVRAQAMAWLETTKPNAAAAARAAAFWTELPQNPAGEELLACLAETIALGDPRAARLLELCSKPPRSPTLPNQAWLLDPKLPPLVAANLRLLYGRWLVQGSLIEEALEQLSGLHPGDVAAPAELLFYQGVVYHRTLNRDEGLRVLNELLDGAESSPRRYVAVAHLMQADLEDLKPDTLDHIARRMEDIWRRLELGRGGPKVRKAEDGVVQSLDKMILKIEKQQQQQQQCSGNGGQNNKPADASRPMGGKGLGEVTKRNIGGKSGWGDLPPKEREEAMQQIGRDFPAHYRDAIEQYFRRLSTEEDSGGKMPPRRGEGP